MDIYLKVLDFSDVCTSLESQIDTEDVEIYGKTVKVVTDCNLAYFESPEGIFVVSSEGTGIPKPIDKEIPVSLKLMTIAIDDKTGEEEVVGFNIIPLGTEEIKKIPILEEEVKLQDFIGQKFSYNYRLKLWNKVLGPFVVKRNAEMVKYVDDVKKYGKFLVKDFCDCEARTVKNFVGINEGACNCGINKRHIHCLSCGKVRV